jgi:hypothetical protein
VKLSILTLALLLSSTAQAGQWEVKPDGLGPYKVGARYENLGKTFGGLGAARVSEDKVCRVARPGVTRTWK